ncbi:MAG: hypothetical protein ABID61_04985 [Candidatus Micrarchaeota archaeon]
MAERQTEGRKPLALVPRIKVNPVELKRLESTLREARQAIVALREYSERMRTGPAPQLTEHADRLLKLLESMKLTSVPIFQERFENEVNAIRQSIELAKTIRPDKATAMLAAAEEQIMMLGSVFELQVKMISGGLPRTYQLGNRTQTETFAIVQDASEGAVLALGTKHDKLARKVLRGFKLLAENYDGYVFEDQNTIAEYRNLTQFIHERHVQMKSQQPYTPQQEKADDLALGNFETNLVEIKAQLRENGIAFLGNLANAIPAIQAAEALGIVATDRYYRLRDDAERVMTRMKGGGELATYDEMSRIITGYFALTGRVDESNLEILREDAKALLGKEVVRWAKGKLGRIKDDTPEWFGLRAMQAIESGNSRLAALAILVGKLDVQSLDQLNRYLPSYLEIRSVIRNGEIITPSMQARFYGELEYARIRVETEQLISKAGKGEKWGRITAAAATVLQRLREGKIREATQLLTMAGTYLNILRTNKWKSWPGSKDMEEAIDSEIAGMDAQEKFDRSLVYHQFKLDSERFSSAWSAWGSGMIVQRRIIRNALNHAEELAKQGKGQEASRVLTLLVFYTDAVITISTKRAGQVYSVSVKDNGLLRGMERTLGAIAKGEQQLDGVDVAVIFMQSFNDTKSTHIKREAARLEALATARPVGREAVLEAINAAKARAVKKDFDGAAMLLILAGDFYGSEIHAVPAEGNPAVKAEKEGWLYAMYAKGNISGTVLGRQKMLEALRLAITAKTPAQYNTIVEQFREGMDIIGRSDGLTRQYHGILAKYRGEIPFHKDDPKGKVSVGDKVYVELAALKRYDEEQAANPTDPLLQDAGRPLSEILRDIERAAVKGDIGAYETAIDAFNGRFSRVAVATAKATAKTQMYDGIVRSLGEVHRVLPTIYGMYDELPKLDEDTERDVKGYKWSGTVVQREEWRKVDRMSETYYEPIDLPPQAERRLGRLEGKRQELLKQIELARKGTGDEVKIHESYRAFMAEFGKEERLANAYAEINGQVKLNQQYRQMAAQTSGWVDSWLEGATYETCRLLEQGTTDLELARSAILAGEMDRAQAYYKTGIQRRVDAMKRYGMEDYPYVQAGSEGFGMTPLEEMVYKTRKAALADKNTQYAQYLQLHMDALFEIMFGDEGSKRTDRLKTQRGLLNGARLIEISMFGIPGRNISQQNIDYVSMQYELRTNVLNAAGAFRVGNHEEGNRLLKEMEARYSNAQKIAEIMGFIGNAAYTVAALGVTLVQPEIGVPMILAQQLDHAYVEYRVEGKVSATSVAMIGLTVVTFGMGEVAAVLRTGSEFWAITATARTLAASRTLTFANLGVGVGMTGYMGYESYHAFQRGDIKNGIFTAGMALFPWLHMAGTGGYAAMRARSTARSDAVARELVPETLRPTTEISPTEVPSSPKMTEIRSPTKLLEFLRSYNAADVVGRERLLAELPESVHGTIKALVESSAIQSQLKGDPTVIDMNAGRELTNAIKLFAEKPAPLTPGGGPRGTLTETEASGWTVRRESLREFLGDLLSPQEQVAGNAHSRLARMRNENPEIAKVVDDLLGNPSVVEDVVSGNRTPFSERGFKTAQERLGGLIPDEILAQEQQAVAQYEVQAAVGYEGPLMMERPGQPGVRQPGEIGGTARPIEGIQRGQIRNMADQPGGRPPTQQPTDAPVGDTAGPVQPQGIKEVAGRVGRGVKERVIGREPTGLTREEIAAPKDYAEAGAEGLEALCGRIDTIRGRRTLMEDAPGQEAAIEAAPKHVANLLKVLYERATNRGIGTELQNHAKDVMAKIYSKGRVRQALDELAGSDPVLRKALDQTRDALTARAAKEGRSPETFIDRYGSGEPGKFKQEDITVIVEILETPGLTEVANAQTRIGGLGRELTKVDSGLQNGREALAKADGKVRSQVVKEARDAIAEARKNVDPEDITTIERLDRLSELVEDIARVDFRSTEPVRLTESASRVNDAFKFIESEAEILGVNTKGMQRARTAWEKGIGKSARELTDLTARRRATTDEIGRIEDVIDRYKPLGETEAVLGIEVPPAVKADMLAKLAETGKLPKRKLVDVRDQSATDVSRSLDALAQDGSPTVMAVRNELGRRAATGGGELDTILLDTLRRPEILQKLGTEAKGALADAALDASVVEWNTTNPNNQLTKAEMAFKKIAEINPELGSFINQTRQNLASDFSAIEKMTKATEGYESEIGNRIGSEIDTRTPLEIVRGITDWNILRGVRGLAGWAVDTATPFGTLRIPVELARTPEGALRFGRPTFRRPWEPGIIPGRYLRSGVQRWRSAQPTETIPKVKAGAVVALQLSIWGYEAYFVATESYIGVYDWVKGTKSIEEGRLIARTKYGMDISEENARFIRKDENGRRFIHALAYLYPQDQTVETGQPARRKFPGEGALEKGLNNDTAFIHPTKIDLVLDEVRGISDELEDANEALAVILDESRESSDEQTEFSKFCTKWHINFGDAVERAKRKGKLDMYDIKELKMDDWIAQGYAFRVNTAVVQQFLIDCGFESTNALEISKYFLTEKGKEMYIKVWNLIQKGNIPVVHAQAAITAVLGEKAKLEREKDVPKAIEELLTENRLLLVDGIKKESVLGWLDRHSMESEEKRELMLRLLANPEYVAAVNNMAIRGNEEILRISEFEEWLATELAKRKELQKPDTAPFPPLRDVAVAAKMIGDPPIKSAQEQDYNKDTLEFFERHPEIANWMSTKNTEYRIQIAEVLERLREHETSMPTNPKELPVWLDEAVDMFMSDLFIKRSTAISQEEATLDRAKLSGAVTRRTAVQIEERRQYPRNTEGGPGKIDITKPITDADFESFMSKNRALGRNIGRQVTTIIESENDTELMGRVRTKYREQGITEGINEKVIEEVLRRIVLDLKKISDGTADPGIISKYAAAGITIVDGTMTVEEGKTKDLVGTHVRETLHRLAK